MFITRGIEKAVEDVHMAVCMNGELVPRELPSGQRVGGVHEHVIAGVTLLAHYYESYGHDGNEYCTYTKLETEKWSVARGVTGYYQQAGSKTHMLRDLTHMRLSGELEI